MLGGALPISLSGEFPSVAVESPSVLPTLGREGGGREGGREVGREERGREGGGNCVMYMRRIRTNKHEPSFKCYRMSVCMSMCVFERK